MTNRRGEAIEVEVARKVASELVAIRSSLETIERSRLLTSAHRATLRETLERVDVAHRALASSLDSVTPDRRWLRAAIKLGGVAASVSLACVTGFLMGEASQYYDIQSPIMATQTAAAEVYRLEAQIDIPESANAKSDDTDADLRLPVGVSTVLGLNQFVSEMQGREGRVELGLDLDIVQARPPSSGSALNAFKLVEWKKGPADPALPPLPEITVVLEPGIDAHGPGSPVLELLAWLSDQPGLERAQFEIAITI